MFRVSRRGATRWGPVDALTVGGDGEQLFHNPDWKPTKLQTSFNESLRLSVRSALDEVKVACVTGSIKISTNDRGANSRASQSQNKRNGVFHSCL